MERQSKVSKLDLAGLDKNPTYLRSVLQSYIRSHNMPIKIFSANGDLHLMRLDLDNNGEAIEWSPEMETTEGALGAERDMDAKPLDAGEVKSRSAKEKGKTTK